MEESYDRIAAMAVESQEKTAQLFERLMEVAQPKSVYSEPVVSGEYTLINASEVSTGIGFGYGLGGGEGTSPDEGKKPTAPSQGSGVGGGGGGGGGSMARPVAVISISPQGVRVEPVVDVTKLGLAMFMTVGSMLMMLSRMRRMSRG